MILVTHAVVGAAAAELFPGHPIIAFSVGFMSHFVLDAIPHWDYKILSDYANSDKAMSINKQEKGASNAVKLDWLFMLDMVRIGADAALGAALVIAIWRPHTLSQWLILFLGAFGGILPDFLQFVYMRFPHQPMTALQKFHSSLMHAKTRLNDRPFLGISSQILVMILAVLLSKYFSLF